jgi:hypothetical protein
MTLTRKSLIKRMNKRGRKVESCATSDSTGKGMTSLKCQQQKVWIKVTLKPINESKITELVQQ